GWPTCWASGTRLARPHRPTSRAPFSRPAAQVAGPNMFPILDRALILWVGSARHTRTELGGAGAAPSPALSVLSSAVLASGGWRRTCLLITPPVLISKLYCTAALGLSMPQPKAG